MTTRGAGWGDTVQTTSWEWLPGGLLERLETRTGTGALVSAHEVSYVDAGGVFANGHRVAETFRRDSPEQATACRDTDCVAAYSFDARERLTAEHVTVAGSGATVTDVAFTLDVAGNVVAQTDGGQTTTFGYFGDQLQWVDPPEGTPRQHQHHDARGNLACVTLTGQPDDCDGIATGTDLPQGVLAAYAWDPFDRLQAYRSFLQDPTGVADPEADSHATYRHDPLDRVRAQTEWHDGDEQAAKTSVFTYLGLTAQVVTEQQTRTATGAAVTTKTYRHDAYGRVTGMVNSPDDPQRGGPAGAFTYGFDVHGSVATLLDDTGQVHAAYGYTPYGATSDELSAGDTDPHDPLNPHRYTAKRLDTGSGSLDMGARRFAPDDGRFLSRDRYLAALADLGLTFDPLTGNRYALAAGSPISYVEHDGRTVIPNGTGRASPQAQTTTYGVTHDGWDHWSTHTVTRAYDRALVQYFGEEAPSGASREPYFLGPIEDHGIIVVRYFIADRRSSFLAGDDRGFDDDPAAPYRVAMAWNTATGEVSTTVAKTCWAWPDAEQDRCASAFPVNSFSESQQNRDNEDCRRRHRDKLSIPQLNHTLGRTSGRRGDQRHHSDRPL